MAGDGDGKGIGCRASYSGVTERGLLGEPFLGLLINFFGISGDFPFTFGGKEGDCGLVDFAWKGGTLTGADLAALKALGGTAGLKVAGALLANPFGK